MLPQPELDQSSPHDLYLTSPTALGPYPARITERLDMWADQVPGRVFLAERDHDNAWRTIAYADFRRMARNAAQALLNRKLSSTRPIAILSGNSIEHALLATAAMYAGIPYAPLSPAYSLLPSDFSKLKEVLRSIQPELVFASDSGRFRHALDACLPSGAELIESATLSSELIATPATAAVDRAYARVNSETIAKILFTSGSTGIPKGVINTHGMLTSNQQMLCMAAPFLSETPPVLCDWLPWHHTFGGNHNFGFVLYNGGTLYIDGGKPTAADLSLTLRNLREIAPTVYFNVPRGFEMLADALRREPALGAHFFSRLTGMLCAGADLNQATRNELHRLSSQVRGKPVPLITGFGSTETAPLVLFADARCSRSGVIGSPVPGLTVKLSPLEDKLELRVRGPNVTPGYWRDEAQTQAAFDAEGFYRTGDAVCVLESPSTLGFNGRIGEDFKLSTGTWVSVADLRSQLLHHCGPAVRHAVIAGQGRGDPTAILFVNPSEGGPQTIAQLSARLKAAYRNTPGSSHRIARATFVASAPSFQAGELTEKGSLNQQAVLLHRAQLVEDLYTNPAPAHVVELL